MPQDTAGFALEAGNDLVWCPVWRCRDKQMEMIGQDFERQYLARE